MQIFAAAFFFFFNFSKTAKAISYNPIQYHAITAALHNCDDSNIQKQLFNYDSGHVALSFILNGFTSFKVQAYLIKLWAPFVAHSESLFSCCQLVQLKDGTFSTEYV